MPQVESKTGSEHPNTLRAALICAAAGILGYITNLLQVPVFGGTSLVFGGIFVVLAAVSCGPWWGGLAAAMAYTQTINVWDHHYGFIIFTLEAIAIGWLVRRRQLSLFRATGLYWLAVGLPLTLVLILTQLRPPYPHNWAMVIKYPANSLLVTLLAQIIILADAFWHFTGQPRSAVRSLEPLRAHLFRRFLVTAALPAAVFAVVSVVTVNQQLRSDAEARLLRQGEQITTIITAYVQQHVQAVRTAASALEGQEDHGEIRANMLDRLRLSNPGFLTMLMADQDGSMVAASPAILVSSQGSTRLNVADREYFRAPVPGGPVYISPVFRGRGFGNDLIIAISASFRDRLGRRQVIEGSLDLGKMRDDILRTPALADRHLVLLDRRSQVIFSHGLADGFRSADLYLLPPQDQLKKLVLDFSSVPTTGEDLLYLGAWSKVPGMDWHLYLRESVWVSESRVASYLLIVLAGMTVALGLAYAAARFTANNLSRPFQDLVANAEALALRQAGYVPRPMSENVPAEWQTLAADLSETASRLAQTHQSLEQAVAERDHINQELRQLSAELDERVRQRTIEADTARVAAEKASQVKSDFLATVSHELRTPLNVALGNIYLLQHSKTEPLSPGQDDRVRRIQTSAQHLLGLINDILDLAKLEAGKIRMNVEPVDLRQLAVECEDFFREEVAQAKLTFDLQVSSEVVALNADKQRLLQILLNLISNAVKFTPAGGKVGLEIKEMTPLDSIQFTVWDTGIGLSAEQQTRLFRPFEQVDRRLNRQYSGIGLGLAIVMRLTKLHGGTVSLVSTPRIGSRFTVTIPKVKVSSTPPINRDESRDKS